MFLVRQTEFLLKFVELKLSRWINAKNRYFVLY